MQRVVDLTEPPKDTRNAVYCLGCGWTGWRHPDAAYCASVLGPDWQPGDIFGEVFGDCPCCAEPVHFDMARMWAPPR